MGIDVAVQSASVDGQFLHFFNVNYPRSAVVVEVDCSVCELNLDVVRADFVGSDAGSAAEIFVSLHKIGGNRGVKCFQLLLPTFGRSLLFCHGPLRQRLSIGRSRPCIAANACLLHLRSK